jgi:hypothetical protein
MLLGSRVVNLTGGVVWRKGVHSVQSGRNLIALPFTSKDNVTLVVNAT